jgi:hypothetical protein
LAVDTVCGWFYGSAEMPVFGRIEWKKKFDSAAKAEAITIR